MTELSPSTFDQLLAALRHPNPNVRAGAAIALGKTRNVRAVDPLVDALEDPVYLVYTSAARALSMIGSLAVGSLIAVIQDPPSPDSAARAYEALRTVSDPQAVGLLCAAASYPEELIRWGALEALGNIRSPQALPVLLEAARHPDPSTRQHAVAALGELALPDALQPITALLDEPDWGMRAAAVQALGKIGSEQAALPLLTAMRDPAPPVREAAAHALQDLRDPQAAEILLGALSGADVWVRRVLALALGEIGNPRAAPALEHLALTDDDLHVRLSAAQSLAKMRHPRGETIILRTLNAPSAQARAHAAIALGNLGRPEAVGPLLEYGLKSKASAGTSMKDLLAALESAGRAAVPALVQALGSPHTQEAEAAFEAVQRIGRAATPELLAALQTEKRPPVRRRLLRLLGLSGDVRAVEFLAETLREGHKSLLSAAGLFDLSAEERKLAADALAAVGAPECAPPLLAAARYDLDAEVRERAARALAVIGEAGSILELAEPHPFGEASRSFASILVLFVVGLVVGGMAQLTGNSRAGLLAGLLAGAVIGLMDGLAGEKRAMQGALAGAGLAAVWGGAVWLFEGSPPPLELVQFPPVRVGAWALGGLGMLSGAVAAHRLSRESGDSLPRGCALVLAPGLLGAGGALAGGVIGAVLVLRAGDLGFYQWLGGGGLLALLLAAWLQRRRYLEVQKGLAAGLGLLGLIGVGIALALIVPDRAAVWLALGFSCGGALVRRRALPLARRLAGLFGGMIAGFAGAGVALLVWP